MKRRRLLQDGSTASEIGLGCMSFAGFYGATDEKTSHETLAYCVDHGLDFMDTSNVYGDGVSEAIIGTFIKKTRAKMVVATKGGIVRDGRSDKRFDNSEPYLRVNLEESLKRLHVDCVDLFYIHRRDPDIAIEDVMETLLKFKREGLIKGIGLSEVSPTTLRRASAVGPVDAVQSEYSLWTRSPELGLIQACRELGTAFVPFSPVGRGLFSDVRPDPSSFKTPDIRIGIPRFQGQNFIDNVARFEPFRALASNIGVATSALALAWVLDQGDHLLPIPGTRHVKHVEHYLSASAFVMTDEIRATINDLLPIGWAMGDRYNVDQWVGVERYS